MFSILTAILALVPLVPGYNLVAGDGRTPEQLHTAIPCITAVYSYDGHGGWSHWFADTPSYVDTLPGNVPLPATTGYMVICDAVPSTPPLPPGA